MLLPNYDIFSTGYKYPITEETKDALNLDYQVQQFIQKKKELSEIELHIRYGVMKYVSDLVKDRGDIFYAGLLGNTNGSVEEKDEECKLVNFGGVDKNLLIGHRFVYCRTYLVDNPNTIGVNSLEYKAMGKDGIGALIDISWEDTEDNMLFAFAMYKKRLIQYVDDKTFGYQYNRIDTGIRKVMFNIENFKELFSKNFNNLIDGIPPFDESVFTTEYLIKDFEK